MGRLAIAMAILLLRCPVCKTIPVAQSIDRV